MRGVARCEKLPHQTQGGSAPAAGMDKTRNNRLIRRSSMGRLGGRLACELAKHGLFAAAELFGFFAVDKIQLADDLFNG